MGSHLRVVSGYVTRQKMDWKKTKREVKRPVKRLLHSVFGGPNQSIARGLQRRGNISKIIRCKKINRT